MVRRWPRAHRHAARPACAGDRPVPHIGGNAYTEQDFVTGVEIHRYGPHLFHTSNEVVWNYLRSFTDFTAYRHRAFSTYRDKVYPLPINLATICQVSKWLSPDKARGMIAEQAADSWLLPADQS